MEIFQYSFVKYSIISGMLIAIISGAFSFFIVMRRLSFLSVGISHSALAGIALGFLFNINPYLTTFIFCIITGFLIGKVTKMGNIEYDTSIGIFFAFTMAIAIFLIFFGKIQINLVSYLFGSIVGDSYLDMIFSIGIFIFSGLFYILFFKELIFITFDEEVARVSGVNVTLFDSIFLIVLTIIIVACVKLVGIIMTSAFLILPASFSLNFSKNYRVAIVVSIFFSIFCFLIGYFLSFNLDIPVGATIVIVSTIIYFCSLIFRRYAI